MSWDTERFLQDTLLLGLAAFLGSLVGWQREAQARPAGLRTHILVALGSCLVTLVRFPGGDTARIAAQIVTGIGFLGAGVILRRGPTVHGLTTAASIWVVAGVGISVGAGGTYAAIAAVATLIVVFTLEAGKRVEHWIRRTNPDATLIATVPRSPGATAALLAALTSAGVLIVSVEMDGTDDASWPTQGSSSGERRALMVTVRLEGSATREALTESVCQAVPDVHLTWV
jgi:putative Mg2+ transporter-C (MgtC) family protein